MLSVEQFGPVLRVSLDRPDVRNALNDELIVEVDRVFGSLDAGIRAVWLRGNGKSFCAGGDLAWMKKAAGYTEEENAADAMLIAGMFQRVADCRAAVVAQVHGAAFGGGFGLVCCADVAVAESGTKFSLSEARLGLVAATISPHVFGKIGRGHARALLTTGEVFGAERALRIGLVHEVVDEAGLEDSVWSKIENVLRNGPEAVAVSKGLAFREPMGNEEAARLLAQMRAGDEGREGVSAFLEKRPASFVVEMPKP